MHATATPSSVHEPPRSHHCLRLYARRPSSGSVEERGPSMKQEEPLPPLSRRMRPDVEQVDIRVEFGQDPAGMPSSPPRARALEARGQANRDARRVAILIH
jgi:hypothetical protein